MFGLAAILSPGSRPASVGGDAVRHYSLRDTGGKQVTEASFAGNWVLMFYGFTHCPDICPTTLLTVPEVLAELGDDGANVIPVFVTIDPERDTAQLLSDYLSNFDSRIVGLTGTLGEIADAA